MSKIGYFRRSLPRFLYLPNFLNAPAHLLLAGVYYCIYGTDEQRSKITCGRSDSVQSVSTRLSAWFKVRVL